jgi:hypothetical protein
VLASKLKAGNWIAWGPNAEPVRIERVGVAARPPSTQEHIFVVVELSETDRWQFYLPPDLWVQIVA